MWAICNIKKGYVLHRLWYGDQGLIIRDQKQLSVSGVTSIFKSLPAIPQPEMAEIFKQEMYSFVTCDDMTLKLWTQEGDQMFLDSKVCLGAEPVSVAVVSTGHIFVLIQDEVQMYSRTGIHIITRDAENFTFLCGWNELLVLGTSEGDIKVIDPVLWHIHDTYETPIKQHIT